MLRTAPTTKNNPATVLIVPRLRNRGLVEKIKTPAPAPAITIEFDKSILCQKKPGGLSGRREETTGPILGTQERLEEGMAVPDLEGQETSVRKRDVETVRKRDGKKVLGNITLTREPESRQSPQAGLWCGLNRVISPHLASASHFSPSP